MSYKAPTYQQIDTDQSASHITPVLIIAIAIGAAVAAIGCSTVE